MNRKIGVVALILCLALVPAFALAEATSLRVTGSATLTVEPDLAEIAIGFSGEDADSAAIQAETGRVIEAVVKAVTALDIAEEDIMTSYVNTYPVYNYLEDGQHLRGYRVEHMLSIVVRDLEVVGDVMDAAFAAGANYANGITYSSSLEKDVYLQALAIAVENAAAKADAMAIASGVWLGSVQEINEQSMSSAPITKYDSFRDTAVMDAGVTASSLGGSVMTGSLKVTAMVELVYAIR